MTDKQDLRGELSQYMIARRIAEDAIDFSAANKDIADVLDRNWPTVFAALTPASSDHAELAERLRDYRPYRTSEGEWFGPKMCEEAAAAILSLEARVRQARIDALEEAVSELADVLSAYDDHDAQLCCNGRECGCEGATVHQAIQHYFAQGIRNLKGEV